MNAEQPSAAISDSEKWASMMGDLQAVLEKHQTLPSEANLILFGFMGSLHQALYGGTQSQAMAAIMKDAIALLKNLQPEPTKSNVTAKN